MHPFFGGTLHVTSVESLDEFRFAARALRDLRSAFVMLIGGGDEMTWQSMRSSNNETFPAEVPPSSCLWGSPRCLEVALRFDGRPLLRDYAHGWAERLPAFGAGDCVAENNQPTVG